MPGMGSTPWGTDVPIPTLIKTWQGSYNLSNTPSGSLETDVDSTFILLKNALLAFALNPWTVVGSGNGTTSGMVGVDLLTSSANIVHNAAASSHSWIVLRQPTGVQVCWDFNNTSVSFATIAWSPAAGFTGGTTTARPTATDEQLLINNNVWQGGLGGTGGQYRGHIIHASDGTCTRMVLMFGGNPMAFWSFETAGSPATGWTGLCGAAVSTTSSAATNLLDWNQWIASTKYSAKGTAAATMPLLVTSKGALSNVSSLNQLNAANEISGEYPIQPCGLWHDVTVGQRGRHGYLFDFFFTVADITSGTTFPSVGTSVYVAIGDMVFPTGGTTLSFT